MLTVLAEWFGTTDDILAGVAILTMIFIGLAAEVVRADREEEEEEDAGEV